MPKKKDVSAIVSGAGFLSSFWIKFEKALRERGASDEMIHRLVTDDGDEVMNQMADLVVGRAKPNLNHDFIPKKSEIIEDVAPSEFKISDLEFISFLEKGEIYVKGEVVRQRAVGLQANLGFADAKYIMNHQAEMPAELWNEHFVFTGTLIRRLDGKLYVVHLSWFGGRLCLYFDCIDNDWGSRGRLVRCKFARNTADRNLGY